MHDAASTTQNAPLRLFSPLESRSSVPITAQRHTGSNEIMKLTFSIRSIDFLFKDLQLNYQLFVHQNFVDAGLKKVFNKCAYPFKCSVFFINERAIICHYICFMKNYISSKAIHCRIQQVNRYDSALCCKTKALNISLTHLQLIKSITQFDTFETKLLFPTEYYNVGI